MKIHLAFKSKHIISTGLLLALLLMHTILLAQVATVDSIRKVHNIPALGFAVVSSDSILAMDVLGKQSLPGGGDALLSCRFHIGSNTKAVTSLLAADLVHKSIIEWETNLFELFPKLKSGEKPSDFTLAHLLNFKVPLAPLSYNTFVSDSILSVNSDYERRYKMAAYLLKQKNVQQSDGLYLTNTGYILAGLMLEQSSGKTYQALLNDLGERMNVKFGIGNPMEQDGCLITGHKSNGQFTEDSVRMNLLLSSGNINISLPDYVRFMQGYLLGLNGKSDFLCKEIYEQLLSSNESYSFGWFQKKDENSSNDVAWNFGNANGFMSSVAILKEQHLAFIILANISSEQAEQGIELIMAELMQQMLKTNAK